MLPLNFPEFQFKLRTFNNRQEIFDAVRRKYVALNPEEWVRQHLIAYLTSIKGYPISIIGVEKQLLLNRQTKRFDLVVFDRNARPLILAECKAPGVEVSEKTFDQAARYNIMLKADFFLITNGLQHYFCRLDYENKRYVFIEDIPHLDDLNSTNP